MSSEQRDMAVHTCSGETLERCPGCGFEDTRDAFEGWVTTYQGAGPIIFAAICPKCEADHPDQSDHDEDGCDACYEEELLS
jgi:hypothetical protein